MSGSFCIPLAIQVRSQYFRRAKIAGLSRSFPRPISFGTIGKPQAKQFFTAQLYHDRGMVDGPVHKPLDKTRVKFSINCRREVGVSLEDSLPGIAVSGAGRKLP